MTKELQQLFIQAFPTLDKNEQQYALTLYSLLTNAQPVSIKQFSDAISLSEQATSDMLNNWTGVSFDEDNKIDGFWGVSTRKTAHSFQINQRTLYTWCAWDLLFVPVIYQQTIAASTTCPLSNKTISLSISETGVKKIEPETAMITFIKPDLDALKANVTGSFCQYIFFVDSEKTGKEWQQTQPNGFLLEIDQGFELGKNIIQQVFNELA